MKGNVVLIYHNISYQSKNLRLYDLNLNAFTEQMRYLNVMRQDTGGKDIIITFDDGYRSWMNEVLEILIRFNIKAYFFVCIEHLRRGNITEDDIRRLKAEGMFIGSHGLTHRYLNQLEQDEIYKELKESKDILERILGEEINDFAVPRGAYNRTVLQAAKEAGYSHVFTSNIGINKEWGFLLKRIPVKRDISLDAFKDSINGRGIGKMICQQKLQNTAKAALGISLYNRFKKMIVSRAE